MKNNNLLAILLLLPIIHVSHCYSADPNHIKPVELTQGVSTKIKPTLTTIKKIKDQSFIDINQLCTSSDQETLLSCWSQLPHPCLPSDKKLFLPTVIKVAKQGEIKNKGSLDNANKRELEEVLVQNIALKYQKRAYFIPDKQGAIVYSKYMSIDIDKIMPKIQEMVTQNQSASVSFAPSQTYLPDVNSWDFVD